MKTIHDDIDQFLGVLATDRTPEQANKTVTSARLKMPQYEFVITTAHNLWKRMVKQRRAN